MSRIPLVVGGLGLLLAAPSVGAQATAPGGAPAVAAAATPATASSFDFSIPNMMRGPEVYGREPQAVRWSPDSRWIYFRWLPPGTDWRETPEPYRVRAQAGATPERLTGAQMDSVGPLLADGPLTPDRKRRVVAHAGDLYLVDRARSTARRLTQTLEMERSPSFATDGKQVFYLRDNNLFALGLDDGLLRQLTDVRQGDAPAAERAATGQRGFLEREQLALLEAVRDEARRDSIEKADRARRDSARVAPLQLGRTERLGNVAVSPTGQALLITTSIPNTGALRTDVPQYVTASGYTEDLTVRTKVGDAQDSGRVAFIQLPSGRVTWLRMLPDDSTSAPSFARLIGWNERGDAALVSAVTPDFKTRYLYQVNADGSMKTLDVLTDSAWVAGPCFGCAGWVDGGATAWFVSEADGYAHIYTVPRGGGERRQLTSGRWEVLGAEVSEDGRYFLLTTNEGSPFEQHFSRMPVSGGARTKLTGAVGGHDVVVSPDGRLLADVHSESNRPPELFVMDNRPGATMSKLTTSPTAAWLSHPWVKPEIVMVRASDGVDVPARIYKPQSWNAQPNGAAVI
ncbi:MAG: DPP IV N-terminal domain-containing protein, partial [Gemmatimonadaceae bacterium]